MRQLPRCQQICIQEHDAIWNFFELTKIRWKLKLRDSLVSSCWLPTSEYTSSLSQTQGYRSQTVHFQNQSQLPRLSDCCHFCGRTISQSTTHSGKNFCYWFCFPKAVGNIHLRVLRVDRNCDTLVLPGYLRWEIRPNKFVRFSSLPEKSPCE